MRVGRSAAGEAGRRIENIERGGGEAPGENSSLARPGPGDVIGRGGIRAHEARLARSRILREGQAGRIVRPVPPAPPPQIFDRALVNRRLDRAWGRAHANGGADFLLARAAEELGERLSLVKRRFALAADFGSPGPHGAAQLAAGGQADRIVRVAPTFASLGEGPFLRAVGDLERLPAAEGRLDLAVSLLALQTVNDLPGALIQMRRALQPDGLLMAAILGGDTLTELRQSFTVAESEVLGGAAPRVAPFVDVRAFGSLAQRAGLALPVVDLDRATVRYGDLFGLMSDLRAFGAANALQARSRTPLRRAVLARAAEVYAERFSDADGRLRATFDVIWLSGWAPHPSQPKPLEPGSATVRLADALKSRR